MAVPILSGLSELARSHDGLIVDVWGVLHDGGDAFPGAINCLAKLRAAKKRVVLLSNAPRRAERVAAGLEDKGIANALYERVISSGDAARAWLGNRLECGMGSAYYWLGPEWDMGLLDGLAYERVKTPSDADFILCIGLASNDETVKDYEPVLAEGVASSLILVCANPDKMVLRQGTPELCAGALAARYEELGGRVHQFGKPHPPVYRLCREALGLADSARILAVGDGLETDIAGANRAGMDSVLVTGGLVSQELGAQRGGALDLAALEALCARTGARPSAAIPAFVW